jgi:hypothetical protein
MLERMGLKREMKDLSIGTAYFPEREVNKGKSPLELVDYAPEPPRGSYWPIVTLHKLKYNIEIRSKDAVGRKKGRAFLDMRESKTKEGKMRARWHAGVDLYANAGDPVVACEKGTIISLKYFYTTKKSRQETCQLLVENKHSNTVINYGEVVCNSLSRLGLKVGDEVDAGRVIGYVSDTSMLHFETYKKGTTKNARWWMDAKTPPSNLLNPTRYLLFLKKHGLTAGKAEPSTAPSAPKAGTMSAAVLPQKVIDALRTGLWSLAVGTMIALGYRDENRLTNMIFFARYPERQNRPLSKGEPGFEKLRKEWLEIRNRLVRPSLSQVASPPIIKPPSIVKAVPVRRVDSVEELRTAWIPDLERRLLGRGARDLKGQNDFNLAIFRSQQEWDLLDPFILKSLLAQESGFRPKLVNKLGFAGIAQLGMEEAKSMGLSTGASKLQTSEHRRKIVEYRKEDFDSVNDQRFRPDFAIPAAAKLLKRKAAALEKLVFSRYGTPQGDDFHKFVLGAYNAGEGTVTRRVKAVYGDRIPAQIRFDDLGDNTGWRLYANAIVARARQS